MAVTPCLACGYPFDAHGELGSGRDWARPPAGSLCMCLACGCLMVMTGDGDLVQPSEEDYAEWRRDPNVVMAIVERAIVVSKCLGMTTRPVWPR